MKTKNYYKNFHVDYIILKNENIEVSIFSKNGNLCHIIVLQGIV